MSSDGLRVTGGVAGIEVQLTSLRVMSTLLGETARDLLVLGADRHRLLVDDDLLASVVLHPVGVARVEAALTSALDGPSGVVAAAVRLELRCAQLLLAVTRYAAVEAVAAEVVELRRWLLGVTAPVLLPIATVVTTGWAAAVVARGGDPVQELERALVDHPGLVDETVGAAGSLATTPLIGLLGPLPVVADTAVRLLDDGGVLLPRDLAETAGLLARLYEPARPRITSAPDTTPRASVAPTGLADLMTRLQDRNERARAGSSTAGDIGVTRLETTGPDGIRTVSWVVDLPGTKDWQPRPGPRPELNDLAGNLELMAGTDNARVDTLPAVLTAAGVGADEPVLLVGHSQGGMVAMRAAAAMRGRFAVSHVVTAGSPVAGMPVPSGVAVLSLEDVRDLVPRLDARPNGEGPHHVTVTSDSGATTVAGAHGLETAYVPAARAADHSDDPSIRAWLDSAHVFLTGAGERTSIEVTTVSVLGQAVP